MRKLILSIIIFIAITSLTNCDLMKDLTYTVEPNPIEMHGNEITVNIDAEFKEKGLNKKALVTLTPTLVNENGEELEFESVSYKGEKAVGNAEVITKDGKKVKYTSTKPYDKKFDNSKLIVKYKLYKGEKEKKEGKTEKIADALIITPLLVSKNTKVFNTKIDLVRETTETKKAQINYLKSKYDVRGSELLDNDIKAFEKFIDSIKSNNKIKIDEINIMSYASPEGEVDKNEHLADDRASSADKYIDVLRKKYKIELPSVKVPKGEDWDGLKELIKNSDNKDKNVIIGVAEMSDDLEKREAEIRTLSVAYEFLEKDIFPQLRRSQITLKYSVAGLSDEEILTVIDTNPKALTYNELFYASNELIEDNESKKSLLNVLIEKDSENWMAYNNKAVILFEEKKYNDAKSMFQKAYDLEMNSTTASNLGAIYHQLGEIEKAETYYKKAGNNNEAKYNKGLIDIMNGDYKSAISNMSNYKTFDKALAYTLNKDYKNALNTLDNSNDKKTAIGNYLKAIIYNRQGNTNEALKYINEASKLDSKYLEKAKNDAEFIKIKESIK